MCALEHLDPSNLKVALVMNREQRRVTLEDAGAPPLLVESGLVAKAVCSLDHGEVHGDILPVVVLHPVQVASLGGDSIHWRRLDALIACHESASGTESAVQSGAVGTVPVSRRARRQADVAPVQPLVGTNCSGPRLSVLVSRRLLHKSVCIE